VSLSVAKTTASQPVGRVGRAAGVVCINSSMPVCHLSTKAGVETNVAWSLLYSHSFIC